MTSFQKNFSEFTEFIKSVSDLNLDPKTCFNEAIKIYEKFVETFGDGGMEEAAYEVKKELGEFKNTELHIAITGETGSGKSSLINALRGLKEEDDGAAPVGVTETTQVPVSYSHPNYPSVKFWDLPGIGSPVFSPESYLQKVDFPRYDFFIIVGSERFRSNHVDLAQEIQRMEKKCYFVRSKVDSDLYNMKRSYPNTFNEEEILEKMRNDFKQQLEKRFRNTVYQVFLTSCWDLAKYDFTHLVETLEEDLPDLKRVAFLCSLPNFSPEVIQKKKSALKSHLWKISLASACINAIPITDTPLAGHLNLSGIPLAGHLNLSGIPLVGLKVATGLFSFFSTMSDQHSYSPKDIPLVCDVALLLGSMVAFYKSFELDDGSLARQARLAGKSVEELKAVIKSPQFKEISRDLLVKIVISSASGFFLPSTISCLASAGMSFVSTYWMLLSSLDNLAEDAERVRKKALEPNCVRQSTLCNWEA